MASLPEHLRPAAVGRERVAREVLEEHQRDRVLKAAADVFSARGYHSTTVDHLVAGAQIGVGSFYSLFKGKEDCFLQLFDRIVADATDQIESAAPDGADWAARVSAGLREVLELVATEPSRARIVLVEAQTAGRAAEERYATLADQAAAILREGRSAKAGARRLPASFEEATVAGLAWLLHQLLVGGEPVDAEGLLPDLEAIGVEPYLEPAA
jgi:AcrR family transcriptional regulator